jgi:hypothetical protein
MTARTTQSRAAAFAGACWPAIAGVPRFFQVRGRLARPRGPGRDGGLGFFHDFPRPAFLEAAEIRLRAERRAGELLAEMRDRGERVDGHGDQKSGLRRATPILSDLGVEKTQSSRWQAIARVPGKHDRNHHAGADADAIRSRHDCSGALRLDATGGFHCVLRDAGRGDGSPRHRTGVSRRREADSMTPECRTCLGRHDPEIHAATLRIHAWVRQRLRRLLEPLPPPGPAKAHPHQLVIAPPVTKKL